MELPGSGFANVSDLVSGTNTGIPGLWLYEINQHSSGPVIRSYELLRGDETTTNPSFAQTTSEAVIATNHSGYDAII